jgi:hypothetical protein
MNLPNSNSRKSAAPDLEEILSRVPLDEQHLSQLSLQENGAEEAARYGEAVFEAQFGDDIQSALANLEAQKQEVARLEDELKTEQDTRDGLARKLKFSDEELAKSPMPVSTMAVQVLLGGCIILLLFLGAHNFAALLIKSGEPFLTRPWMAYLTALTAAFMVAVVVECFISLPKHDATKRLFATISLGTGVLSGLCYLAILSHLIKPEFTETDISSLIPALGASTPVAGAFQGDEWFGKGWSGWLLFCQFVAEATGAAGLGYFFARNMKAHRAACARNNPDFVAAEADVEKAAGRLNATKDHVGKIEGCLRVLGQARVMVISKAKARVIALQRVIQMIFKVSAIKPQTD